MSREVGRAARPSRQGILRTAWVPALWVCLATTSCHREVRHVDLPALSLSQMEPAVQRHLQARWDAAHSDPRATTLGLLAMALDAHDLLDPAAVVYGLAADADPNDPRWPFLRALALPDAEPSTREPLFARAATLAPRELAPVLRLAWHHLDHGDPERAEIPLRAAESLRPNDAHVAWTRARLEFHREHWDAALEAVERARKADPRHRESVELLARLERRLGREESARRTSQVAATLDPKATPLRDPWRREVLAEARSSPQLRSQMEAALAAGDSPAAMQFATALSAANPSDRSARRALGRALLAMGRPAEAVGALEPLADADSSDEDRFLLATASRRAGDLPRAATLFREVLARDDRCEVRAALAEVLHARGESREAIAVLTPLSGTPSLDRDTLNLWAWILSTAAEPSVRDGDAAVEQAERVCAVASPPHWHLGTLAAALAASGRFPDAVAAMDRATSAARAAGDREFLRTADERRLAYASARIWLPR